MAKKNRGRVLLIGAGAAGSVVAQKCASRPETFRYLHIASRTLNKCQALKDKIHAIPVSVSELDADDTNAVIKTIETVQPELVINMALPYQDLSIMDACLATKVHYMDTANYEPKDKAEFCYGWQWDYHERFKAAGIMALLGSGFDPGVTNVFCAYAAKTLFDELLTLDIIDCNDGEHGHPFATNFNPEINIREITQKGKYYESGQWHETDPLSVSESILFPGIGERKAYLMYHEELESLVRHFPSLQSARFWMTFSESYLMHLKVLENVGMTRIDPIPYQGQDVIPLEILKLVLPTPASLGPQYTGETCIGCRIKGRINGEEKTYVIYNRCQHADCYKELGSQAVSYTTGVPAMIGASMILDGKWTGQGVYNIEQFDPDPFMALLSEYGLPWTVKEEVPANAVLS